MQLQEMVNQSCSFYEHMESKHEGSIEMMLTDLRKKIESGKVKIDKREQYDP